VGLVLWKCVLPIFDDSSICVALDSNRVSVTNYCQLLGWPYVVLELAIIRRFSLRAVNGNFSISRLMLMIDCALTWHGCLCCQRVQLQ
jgi:hypothetical protein